MPIYFKSWLKFKNSFNKKVKINVTKLNVQTSLYINAAMSNPRPTCSPDEGFVQPSLGFRCSKSIPHTNNLSLFW